jgi:hypothetical protein
MVTTNKCLAQSNKSRTRGDFVSDLDGLRLISAFMRIDNATLRRRIVMLVQEIAGDDD